MTNWTIEKEEALMKNNHFRNALGIRVEQVEEGKAVLVMPVTELVLQGYQVVHGGVFATIADSVIGTAIRTVVPEGSACMTAEMNINYFRSVKDGNIIAEGKTMNCGKTVAVGTADVKDESGRLLAHARATFIIKQPN